MFFRLILDNVDYVPYSNEAELKRSGEENEKESDIYHFVFRNSELEALAEKVIKIRKSKINKNSNFGRPIGRIDETSGGKTEENADIRTRQIAQNER